MNLIRLSSFVSPGSPRSGHQQPSQLAYRVPWAVLQRDPDGTVEVLNIGTERLRFVRFAVIGAGLLGMSLPGPVDVNERLSVRVRGLAAEPASLLLLRWFRPHGGEYLWPIAF
ncbi:hypothetical protein [Leucobacter sp. M11]|uniref:hypothetical protein n=1 Tax=Leucobacter sp. M11 TaxID=2993565 RepID=UPI002D806C80|nr:hypothetical protein [Leucobacter sp. M11]MEB4614631.1 hypothetical protein [Leucobacter sp. M11]